MNRAGRRQQGKAALELLEEAVHLLRTAAPAALASYYLGALPFVLGLLYFWADMSRNASANQHLAGATLGMATLFVWMKFWQAVFARQLRAQMAGESAPPLSFRQCGRMALTQTALQPSGLFVLPLALIPALPFAWVYAFYQNLTALTGGESTRVGELVRKAGRQAALWPVQNHLLLLLVPAFGFCVLLNWATVCFILPGLVKMLFGVESIFTRSEFSLLNTTFFAGMFCLTYLCVDPLLKAVYALRCFYGESQQSGEDLKAELRRFGFSGPTLPVCLLLALVASGVCQAAELPAPGGESATAVEPAGRPPLPSAKPGANASGLEEIASSLSAPEFDRTIRKVIDQSKYSWRAPREKRLEAAATQRGLISRFLVRIWTLMWDALKTLFGWIKDFFEWLFKWLGKLLARLFRPPAPSTPTGYGWVMSLHILLYVLVLGIIAGLGFLGYRIWRKRQRRGAAIASEPIQPVPDLADENVGAEELPEEGWSRLGGELLARGELRLALRAFYLASLAHLAARNLLRLEKFKSNRDYERELRRRGHSFPELLATFGANVSVFDRTWYGLHDINAELVSEFAANVERIKSGGAR